MWSEQVVRTALSARCCNTPSEVGHKLFRNHSNRSSRRDELSTEAGCLLWGTRVIIPSKLRETVLSELHQGHPGVSAMRSYLWWPNLDKDLETTARSCLSCQAVKHPQLQLLFTHGYGLPDRGNESMWTLLGFLWGRCFSWLSMRTQFF